MGRVLSSMLYDVSGFDPLVFVVAPLVLAGASLFASYLPARRATRVNPLSALRQG
jgi:putative ABC transport system permease protein